jgi:predicted DNA-binding transcriptional regulator AlpA
LYELRKAGKIPEVHLTDHCVRFRRSDLDEFVGRRLEKPAAFSITSSRS